MAENRAADEVMEHGEDEGEWDDAREQIESRPTGTQVISTRLPSDLAEALLAEAERRQMRPSELVRHAIEAYMRPQSGVAGLTANSQGALRLPPEIDGNPTENANPVVEIPTEPLLIAIGL
jgi:hypothetical protein